MQSKKVLIFGNLADPHMIRFAKHLNIHNDGELNFFFFGGDYKSGLSRDATNLYTNAFFIERHFPQHLYDLPFFRRICHFLDLFISFAPLFKYKFDCINIHSFGMKALFLFPILRFKAKKILISPWGSDVYRISRLKRCIFKYTGFKFSDFISSSGKFKEDIKLIYNISDEKIIELFFGSDLISVIHSKENVPKEESKHIIGVTDSQVIVCGYNANPAQNHQKIISSLIQIKDKIPSNTILIFPLTYGPHNPSYIKSIKETLNNHNFKYLLLQEYLSENELFNYINSADLMIHMQESDAFSSAIKEYLLCNAKVINGSWLRYPNLEFAGVPYHLVDNFAELSSKILEVLGDKRNNISDELKAYLLQFSWGYIANSWITVFKSI